MPLWHVNHPEGAFSADDRRDIAQTVTGIYAPFMPRFYVNVLFQAVPECALFIGGEPHDRFVRIWADHIARRVPDDETAARFLGAVAKLLAPWIADRGYEWEFHADETPFRLWSVQGILDLQAVEVTPAKEVVWALEDWKNLGDATSAQFLDEPGIPEVVGATEH